MRKILLVLLISGALFGAPQGKGKGKDKQQGQGGQPASASQSRDNYATFRDAEIRIITDYYRPGGGNAIQSGSLPPGIAKNLQRGKPLPPGIAKKVFPNDLNGRLPGVPVGYQRYVYDRYALLVQDATNLVVDIIDLTRR